MIKTKDILTHSSLISPAVKHGFFTRNGGVSQGIYQGLNCGAGSDDDPEHIQENRNRVGHVLGVEDKHLISLYQVHSADVYVIDNLPDLSLWNSFDRPKADAIVTKRDDIALGILTADCGPILFSDPIAGVVAAAHAGWKGAIGGVMENTITAMEEQGADRSNISAVLGPCIHQKSYEVGQDFVDQFIKNSPDNEAYFAKGNRQGHSMFDLPKFIMDKMTKLELKSTGIIDVDTKGDPDRFYSYRRKTLLGEADYGRQISAIALQEG